MDIKAYLSEKKSLIDAQLKGFLPSDGSVLSEAMRYSALAPGKRIRAILTIASAQAVGGDEQTVVPVACSIELIHTFSLIHDDLPAMDNDDLRRGLPTSHKKFGEATAILAADALFALAFEILSGEKARKSAKSEGALLEIVNRISSSIGAFGMCSGQSLDMLSEGKKITLEELKLLHKRKTGDLISASVFCGARMFGPSHEQISKLEEYASHIGLAFQIKDDILDLSGTALDLGKNPGSDVKKNKSTFPSLLGMERSMDMLESERSSALKALAVFGNKAELLKDLADYIVDRNR